MRISEIGSEMSAGRQSQETGFTLVETLAALSVMALMASVVVLTLPSSGAEFRSEVRQLAARLEMAAQESIVGGRPLGLVLSDDGYAFRRMRNGVWEEIASDRVFAPHRWADRTYFGLELNSFFPVEDASKNRETADTDVPLLRFDPTGLTSDFAIRLERGTVRYVLRADGRNVEVSDANL